MGEASLMHSLREVYADKYITSDEWREVLVAVGVDAFFPGNGVVLVPTPVPPPSVTAVVAPFLMA